MKKVEGKTGLVFFCMLKNKKVGKFWARNRRRFLRFLFLLFSSKKDYRIPIQIEKWKKHEKQGYRKPYRISQKTRKTAKKGYRIPISPRKSTSLLKTPSKNSPKTLKKGVFPQMRTESGRPKLGFSPKIYVKKMKKTAKKHENSQIWKDNSHKRPKIKIL